MQADATYRTCWSARITGLLGLLLAGAGAVGLGATGGAPGWTWAVLAIVGGAAAAASVANFGERLHVGDRGIRHENVLTRRAREATWDRVLRGIDHEGRTWFLEIEGQRRWVVDQLDGHDALGLELQQRGVPVDQRRRPRLIDRLPFGRT